MYLKDENGAIVNSNIDPTFQDLQFVASSGREYWVPLTVRNEKWNDKIETHGGCILTINGIYDNRRCYLPDDCIEPCWGCIGLCHYSNDYNEFLKSDVKTVSENRILIINP